MYQNIKICGQFLPTSLVPTALLKEKGEGENDENKVPNCFQQHKKNERGRNESRSGWSSALNKFLQTSPVYVKALIKLWPSAAAGSRGRERAQYE